MEVKDTYTLKLSPFQIEILIDTVAGFVDNKKLLHLPDHQGKIVSLPLTMEVLQAIKSVMEQKETQDSMEIHIDLHQGKPTAVMKLSMLDYLFEYDVDLDEFDPV